MRPQFPTLEEGNKRTEAYSRPSYYHFLLRLGDALSTPDINQQEGKLSKLLKNKLTGCQISEAGEIFMQMWFDTYIKIGEGEEDFS